MEIAKWVTQNPVCVERDSSLLDVAELMHAKDIGAVLVVSKEDLIGIFTERDLLSAVARESAVNGEAPVSRYMTPEPITAQTTDDYNSVYMLMKTNAIRHIPVLNGSTVVGIVSIRDLIHFYQNKLETEFAEARDRIDDLKKLVHLSADEVIDTLFSEISRYKALSLTDHLTGLYNKRYFLMRLQEEISRAKRYGQELSLIFCDLDHFKRVNDNYGHSSGDKVLRTVGGVLAGGMGDIKVVSRLRKSDIVARYGGEEFVVILPETTPENAKTAAEKVRRIIEVEEISVDGTAVRVTMSFGVAGVSEEVNNVDDLIRRADHAMYRAKQNGRNRVEVYTEEGFRKTHSVHA